MAAPNLPLLVPTLYSSQTGTAWQTTTVGNIDNGVQTPDGLSIVAGANSTSSIYYRFTTTPIDFVKMLTLSGDVRVSIANLTNDTQTLQLSVYKSDKTTLLTDKATVAVWTSAQPAFVNLTGPLVLNGVGMSATKADWDAAFLCISTIHQANMGSNGSVWSIDEVEMEGTYEAPPSPVVLDSPADAANVTLAPELLFTGTDLNGNEVEYNIQIDSSAGFNSGRGPIDTFLRMTEQGASGYWYSIGVNSSNGDVYVGGETGEIYKQANGGGDFISVAKIGTVRCEGMAVNSTNGDVYACLNGNTIYKQTGGVGSFDIVPEAGNRTWTGVAVNPSNGDLYACTDGADVYKQTGGVGAFVALGVSGYFKGITVNSSNGDVFICSYSNDIFKQTAGSGAFVALNATGTNRVWYGVAVNSSNGSVYACVNSGDIYKQTNGVGDFLPLNATGANKSWRDVAVNPSNGDVYASDFNMYGRPMGPLMDMSSTVDEGFLDSPDQGDTHPFTSGTQVAYTVQSDLTPDVVYYWKVRAIDPTGSNTWGDWSTVRSFRTQPATGWISKNIKIGAWTTKPLKVYIGGQWVVKPLKYFK